MCIVRVLSIEHIIHLVNIQRKTRREPAELNLMTGIQIQFNIHCAFLIDLFCVDDDDDADDHGDVDRSLIYGKCSA